MESGFPFDERKKKSNDFDEKKISNSRNLNVRRRTHVLRVFFSLLFVLLLLLPLLGGMESGFPFDERKKKSNDFDEKIFFFQFA